MKYIILSLFLFASCQGRSILHPSIQYASYVQASAMLDSMHKARPYDDICFLAFNNAVEKMNTATDSSDYWPDLAHKLDERCKSYPPPLAKPAPPDHTLELAKGLFEQSEYHEKREALLWQAIRILERQDPADNPRLDRINKQLESMRLDHNAKVRAVLDTTSK